jgi:hypothetical protein
VDVLIARMQRQKNIATFAAQRFLQFYISEVLNSTKEDIHLLPECVIQAHASPFLFKKGSPFISPVNRIVLTAVEAGLTQYWFTYSTPKMAVSRLSGIPPLSLRQLAFVFIVLLIGLSSSVSVFVAELRSNSDSAKIKKLQKRALQRRNKRVGIKRRINKSNKDNLFARIKSNLKRRFYL